MAKRMEYTVTVAPCSEATLQRAKDIFNKFVVKRVLAYIHEEVPEEQQEYVLDEYIRSLKEEVEKEKNGKVAHQGY